jgi:hypothetical protein
VGLVKLDRLFQFVSSFRGQVSPDLTRNQLTIVFSTIDDDDY